LVLFGLHALHGSEYREHCVVHPDVDRTELTLHTLGRRLDRRRIGDIERENERDAAGALDVAARALEAGASLATVSRPPQQRRGERERAGAEQRKPSAMISISSQGSAYGRDRQQVRHRDRSAHGARPSASTRNGDRRAVPPRRARAAHGAPDRRRSSTTTSRELRRSARRATTAARTWAVAAPRRGALA